MSAEPQKVETSTPATRANYNTTPTRDVDHIKRIADAYHHDPDYSNDSSKLGMQFPGRVIGPRQQGIASKYHARFP